MHRDGFGFVIPDASSLSPSLKSRLVGDIFIPPHAIGNAMHGDRVLVDIAAVRPDGRAEGRIVRPVVRAHPTVVGIFHYGTRHNSVKPIDSKITMDIVIPAGAWNVAPPSPPETASEKPPALRKSVDRVLGDEAARRSQWDDLEGVVVDVEITDWPTPTQNPRGRVIEILGRPDDFGVDVEITIRKFHLPHHFPAATLEEAQNISPIIPAPELRHRRDFRALPIVTIDGETARDFDDAVTVRNLPDGNFELQVHIADVAQYVTPDSALDQEARLRGTSVYFPDRAVPMLPLELSTDICSLRPHLDRLVLSCVMRIDPRGEILGYELCEGVIRSAERMTYTAVNAVIEGDAAARERYATACSHVRTHARSRADPQPQTPAPRLDRFRSARAGHRVRRIRIDEKHHALGAQHRASPDRRVHALGQRMRRAVSGIEAHRVSYIESTKSPTPSASTTSK